MKPGIEITKTELIFNEFSSKETGIAKHCKSFKLKLNDTLLIALSPRLMLDDEAIFIILIDKSKNIYPIPDNVLDSKGLENFENYFNLTSIRKDWEKFEYNDHYGRVDKIIYPLDMYWNDLFKKDWKLLIRSLYRTFKPKSFFGNFNNLSKDNL